MNRHPWRRLCAWAIDCCLILVYAGLLAAVAVPLYLSGHVDIGTQLMGNIVAALVLVVPAVCVLAALEASKRGSTVGKRLMKLNVARDTGVRMTFIQSVARNAMKFGIPWLIGHAAVYALVQGDTSGHATSPVTWILLALAYVVPIVWLLSLFIRDGRTPYDRLTKTRVRVTMGG